MRTDDRKENTRDVKINISTFIYKNYKDIMAVILILVSLGIFVAFEVCDKQPSEKLSTLLISLVSGATGFIFGKKVV